MIFLLVMLVVIGLPIWALVDAVTRPQWAFEAAGHSKTLWIALGAIGIVFFGPVLALVYLLGIRPSVVRQTRSMPAGHIPAPMPPSQAMPPPAGWYPDPSGGGQLRYWDGSSWTEHLRETNE